MGGSGDGEQETGNTLFKCTSAYAQYLFGELYTSWLSIYSRFQVDEVQSLGKIPDFSKKSGICMCTSLTWKAL